MREVADRAGVALSSVSRVLSEHPDVSVVMRNRVLDAVAALGYEPDILAQSLRRGATMSVGFVVGDISNPLLSQVALGAEVRLRATGYSMLLTNSVNNPGMDAEHVRLLAQRRVDGLLLSLADETDTETAEALRRANVPAVLVDRGASELPNVSAVLSDHSAGITAAVHHLTQLGHRQIALVNGNPKVRPARVRANALRQACRGRRGVSVTVRSGEFSADHGQAATLSLLAADKPPTAIIAGGNQILAGVLRAVQESRVDVPGDLSLVTCDDLALSEFLSPALSTVSRDPGEIGSVAAELLVDLIHGSEPQEVTLPVGFRPTDSCTPPKR
jgi:LacI family transcriptional regulator